MTHTPLRRAVALGVGIGLTAALGLSAPANAESRFPDTIALRLCDPTGCYVAWNVVDSDHDGASDADELMAGSDPHDAASRPPLPVVAELGAARELPSFEAGLGAFLLFPAELLEAREALGVAPEGAFPVDTRADALTRMGISPDTLSQFGLSPDTAGLTIGLDAPTSGGGLPGARVSGMDASLISAGTDPPTRHVGNGGVKSVKPTFFGSGSIIEYRDGTRDEVTTDSDGVVTISRTNPDGKEGPTRVIKENHGTDGDVGVDNRQETTTDSDGHLLSEETTETHRYPNGAVSEMSTKKDYVYDDNGTVTGTIVTTTVSYISADGEYGSSATTVEKCDANGDNCTETSYEFQDSDTAETDEYVDAEVNPTIVTQEMIDGVIRTRGAAITVRPGWTAPGLENDPENPQNPGAVALVDSELGAHYLLVEPLRVTTAQPETRPDLPNPLDGAPLPANGGCGGLC